MFFWLASSRIEAVTITGFSSDENNQPVAQTDKGEHKIFKPRIAKLMPAK
jgi:hypothetical protein